MLSGPLICWERVNAPIRTEFRLGLFPPKDQGGKGKDKLQPPPTNP